MKQPRWVRFAGHRLSDKLLQGSLWLFLGTMVANICNYLFQFFMSRQLSVADFGAMNSLFSVLMVSSVPAVTILLTASKNVSNFHAHQQLEKVRLFRKKLLSALMRYGLPGLLVLASASFWLASFLQLASVLPVLILLLAIFFSFLLPVNSGTLQGLQRFLPLGMCAGLLGLLKLLGGVALVVGGFGLYGALAGVLLATVCVVIIQSFYLRDLPPSPAGVDDVGLGYKKILSYSLPVMFSSLGIMGLTNLDMILVKHYFPPEESGLYASVAVLGRTIFYIPGVIVMAMFPIVAESYALRQDSFRILRRSLGLTALFAGAGALVLILFPDLMLSFLFGKTFSGNANLLRIFVAAMFFMALLNTMTNFFLAIEKKRFILVLLLGCLVELVLIAIFHQQLYMIPCIATFVSAAICLVLLAGIVGMPAFVKRS